MNNDPWTCTLFDARGRTISATQPTIQGRPGRTISYFYAVDGNPLKTRVTDSTVGSSEAETDLLGRTKWSKDVWGNTYTTTFRMDEYLPSQVLSV